MDFLSHPEARALPLYPRLAELRSVLEARRLAVLRADPGSGKTSLAPLALAGAFPGRILVLEPRRLAAVAAASRLAELSGGELGGTVGYSVRMERRVSSRTRIEVVTEGLLPRRLQADPGLEGVSAVVFDEFHERSAVADLALALVLDLRRLREDLAVLVMSATLDADRLAAFLGEAEGRAVPVVDCPVRRFPVTIEHRPLPGRAPLGMELARAAAEDLLGGGSSGGDALAFLPGKREIADAASALRSALGGAIDVAVLHGGLPLAEQRAVVAPEPGAKRRVVLATNVAETSLTVPRVTLVVDSGWVRLERFHVASSLDRLSLERASVPSADQRAGRAGRLAPGRCLRLWAAGDPGPASTEPELLRTELSSVVLDCLLWGARSPLDLAWLDPPPRAAWERAVELLGALGAVDSSGAPTEKGRRMAGLGAAPRLAALVLAGVEAGAAGLACAAAAALSDRDGSGIRDDADFRRRIALLRGDPRELSGVDRGAAEAWRARTLDLARDLAIRAGAPAGRGPAWRPGDERGLGAVLAAGFPDLVARRQDRGAFRLPSGREVLVAGELAREAWLVVAEADAGERTGAVRACAPLDEAAALAALSPLTKEERRFEWAGLVPRAVAVRAAGRLELSEVRARPEARELPRAVAGLVADKGLAALPWDGDGGRARRLLDRVRFWAARGGPSAEAWTDAAMAADAEDWLGPHLRADGGPVLDADGLCAALRGRLGWEAAAALDSRVPERFRTPAGSSRPLDYSSGEAVLEVRIQEVFGLSAAPAVLGEPVLLRLLSPAERPLQVTRDLAGFWRGSYAEVRKEMRGRYPRHYWPEDPLVAEPTTRAKPRGT